MNSYERHQARYERRRDRRRDNLERCNAEVGGVEDVFTFADLFKAGTTCCNGVRWKGSVQNFEIHLFRNTARVRRELLGGTWKPGAYNSFFLTERGKRRPIDAPTIRDRQVHKVLVRRVLIPLYTPSLIDDNGASLEGKGFHYALKKTREQMHRHFRKYGMTGWAILLDCSNFFPSANHDKLKERHARYILDDGLRQLTDNIIEANGRKVGVPLGVEASQLEMVSAPSAVDNHIRCQMRLPYSGHYMDDFHIFTETREEAERALAEAIAVMEREGFHVNKSKTRIIPVSRGFRYCKAKFLTEPSGRIVTHGAMRSFRVARRKIKMFARKLAMGYVKPESVYSSIQASVAYFRGYDNHNRSLRLARYAYALIGGTI